MSTAKTNIQNLEACASVSIILTYFKCKIVENCMKSQSLDYLVKKPLKITFFIECYEVSSCHFKLQTWIKLLVMFLTIYKRI